MGKLSRVLDDFSTDSWRSKEAFFDLDLLQLVRLPEASRLQGSPAGHDALEAHVIEMTGG